MHRNQIDLILKNKFVRLGQLLRLADETKRGMLSYETFDMIIKNLNISDSIISQKDVQSIFNQYKVDDHKMDYRNLLQHLADF